MPGFLGRAEQAAADVKGSLELGVVLAGMALVIAAVAMVVAVRK
jgi:hypothetical protein